MKKSELRQLINEVLRESLESNKKYPFLADLQNAIRSNDMAQELVLVSGYFDTRDYGYAGTNHNMAAVRYEIISEKETDEFRKQYCVEMKNHHTKMAKMLYHKMREKKS